VPLRFDPATAEGRENLGFLPEEQQALEGTTIISLPRSPGEDISCLNVARPALPRLLGVTDALIERGGFSFAGTESDAGGNPWALLREDADDGALPALTDAASLTWQLHSAVGEAYDAGGGRPLLRFVGALQGSIFQSEILIHADALREIYPEIAGPSYFLIDAAEGRDEQVAEALRAALGEMGLQVRSTREVLNRYITVQNTYLTMFLALGGLGLLLGTIGLVAVILRSAFERRGEFALMLATGFTRENLTWLVLVENAGLLLAGMAAGTLTALVAVAPHLASEQANVNWSSLAAVLTAGVVVGLAACAAGARATVRGNLIEALRTE
jgi:putative ABC transport system permease protein